MTRYKTIFENAKRHVENIVYNQQSDPDEVLFFPRRLADVLEQLQRAYIAHVDAEAEAEERRQRRQNARSFKPLSDEKLQAMLTLFDDVGDIRREEVEPLIDEVLRLRAVLSQQEPAAPQSRSLDEQILHHIHVNGPRQLSALIASFRTPADHTQGAVANLKDLFGVLCLDFNGRYHLTEKGQDVVSGRRSLEIEHAFEGGLQ